MGKPQFIEGKASPKWASNNSSGGRFPLDEAYNNPTGGRFPQKGEAILQLGERIIHQGELIPFSF